MAQDDLDQPEPEDTSIGGRLRAAREARGLSLQDIANQTRIPVRHLQHVEQEEWDDLPAHHLLRRLRRAPMATRSASTAPSSAARCAISSADAAPASAAVNYYEPADPARVPPRSLAIVAALIAIAIVVGYALWRSSLSEVEPTPRPDSRADRRRPSDAAPGRAARLPPPPASR